MYKRYTLPLTCSVDEIPRGLKSKFVGSLKTHEYNKWHGRISREALCDGFIIKIILGHPLEKPSVVNWFTALSTMLNIFSGVIKEDKIEESEMKVPAIGSIYRNPLFVGKTPKTAARSCVSNPSSGEYESMSGVLEGTSSIYTRTEFIGDSVSQTGEKNKTLQRTIGELTFGETTLDKIDCSTWSVLSIKKLLATPCKQGGIGLSQKKIENIDIEGSDFENIIDALIRFNGDEEAKIEHATKGLDKNLKNNATSESIVRWVFRNLLEYK